MKRNSYIGLFVISMCVVVLGFVNIGNANHQGYDCLVCHDEVDTRNLMYIREVINTPNSGPMEAWFTSYEGWHSFADGDIFYDGVCEVCHTTTHYHTNYGDGTVHFDAQDCTECHPHTNDFYPTFPGQQSHLTHFNDPKGPQIGTDTCFTACHLSSSDFRIFKDNQPIETTNVCDACHSPSGSFNGVGNMNPGNPNSVAYGAKYNWDGGIYEPAVPPDLWPSMLKAGKENWCATCHDDGTSVVNSVSAPNIMGDNTSYGYTVSGHGEYAVRCDDCHDPIILHTDGQSRTYSASNNNYRDSYRLNEDMAIPRNGESGPIAFELCMKCHVYSYITGPNSKFRYDKPYLGQNYLNLHYAHLVPGLICWDSDWDENSTNCSEAECADSEISCTACHNVHGSPTPAMIRHGELISTPGTTDKVPALDFRWYKADGFTQTMILGESRYGGLLCGQYSNVSFNHVCWGCHIEGEIKYYRTPAPLTLTLLSPNGGDVIPSGSTYTVRWIAPQEAVKFTLAYSKDNGATWNLIANNLTGTSYDWQVPALLNNKKQCLVKVKAFNSEGVMIGKDKSDSVFTIEVVKLTSPDGGEVLTSGSSHTITWTTHATKNPVTSVKLTYTTNGGSTWTLIDTPTGNQGSYNWTVPNVSSSSCKVKVVLKDATGTAVGKDASDGFFTIQ